MHRFYSSEEVIRAVSHLNREILIHQGRRVRKTRKNLGLPGVEGSVYGYDTIEGLRNVYFRKPGLTFSQLSKATYRNVVRENVRTNPGMTQLYKAAKREVCCMISNTEQFKLL